MLQLYDRDVALTKPYPVEIAVDSVTVGGHSFPFQVRRDARARRMLLRVMPRNGEVVLVLPIRASLKSGQQFVTEQADWIMARQSERPLQQIWEDGAVLPLYGAPHKIRHRPEARGGPVNPACKRLLLGHAFEAGAVRVEIITDAINPASQAAISAMRASLASARARAPASASVPSAGTRRMKDRCAARERP